MVCVCACAYLSSFLHRPGEHLLQTKAGEGRADWVLAPPASYVTCFGIAVALYWVGAILKNRMWPNQIFGLPGLLTPTSIADLAS